jgi:hypothetical protein
MEPVKETVDLVGENIGSARETIKAEGVIVDRAGWLDWAIKCGSLKILTTVWPSFLILPCEGLAGGLESKLS